MQLITHTAFGLLLGTVCYFCVPGLDFGFVLLAGFAAFLPDIDWVMQCKWGMGAVHRKLLHNIWAMLALVGISLAVTHNTILTLGVIVGFTSHLLTDSITRMGVHWLYPLD